MRKAILVTLVALAVAALLPATASAQATATGTMALDIRLPNIVILYYYSNVRVDIAANDLFSGNENEVDVGAYGPGSGLSPDLAFTVPGVDSGGNPDLSNVALTLNNSWAVRALSTSGNVTVAFSADSASLSGGSGTIGIASVGIDSTNAGAPGSSSDPVATPAQITFASPGLASYEMGDLLMGLDLSTAGSTGSYTGSFTITASTL